MGTRKATSAPWARNFSRSAGISSSVRNFAWRASSAYSRRRSPGEVSATISGGSYGSNSIQNLLGGTLTIVGTSFDLGFGPVNPGGSYNGPLTGTPADGSAMNTTLVKSSGSSVTLVDGTQGPLTSAVCGDIGAHVPTLPTWAIGLVLMALAASGATLGRRLHRAA